MKKIETRELYAKLATRSNVIGQRLRRSSTFLHQKLRSNTMRSPSTNLGLKFSTIVNLIVLLLVLSTGIYWGAIASDLYVSESAVIVQRTDAGAQPAADFTALLGNAANVNRPDQLLLREYLLSKDVLKKLDDKFDLKKHYSDHSQDVVSRLWNEDASIEELQRYFQNRLTVELDEYSTVLKIKVQAYDPAYSLALNKALIGYGEAYMNQIAQELASGQVGFLEQQVAQLNLKLVASSQKMLEYQNKKGLISPKVTTESISSIIAQLEGQRTQLETTLAGYEAYLVPTHHNIVQTKQQLAAVRQQIIDETQKLASPSGGKLNKSIEEFQRLELEVLFATEMYKSALGALEKVRIEAVRNIKKVSLLQSPTLPEYAEVPRRIYNTISFIIIILLLSGVVHLMGAIVRDHRN